MASEQKMPKTRVNMIRKRFVLNSGQKSDHELVQRNVKAQRLQVGLSSRRFREQPRGWKKPIREMNDTVDERPFVCALFFTLKSSKLLQNLIQFIFVLSCFCDAL